MLRRGIVGDRAREITFLSWDSYGGAPPNAVNAIRCIDPDVDLSPSTRDPSAFGPFTCSSTVPVARKCE
jgi:hypothetical protein